MSVKRMIKIILMVMVVFMPLSAFAGKGPDFTITTDTGTNQLVSYYDLRNRETFVQVTNTSSSSASIHVQIFQNDTPDCDEIDFYDTLTGNDTHIYNMRALSGNALPVNIDLDDLSNGIVVITLVSGTTPGSLSQSGTNLIGNFRIVDATGYEYRSNSAGIFDANNNIDRFLPRYTLNFSQIGGNNFADVIGVNIDNVGPNEPQVFIVDDLDTIPFVFDFAENPTSCDDFDFFCGGEAGGAGDFLNVGINDIFPSTNGDQALCNGNTTPGGFVELLTDEGFEGDEVNVGFIGLNNGNGMGSMDSWIGNNFDVCGFLQDDFGGDCNF